MPISAVPAGIELLRIPITLPISCMVDAPDSDIADWTFSDISDSFFCCVWNGSRRWESRRIEIYNAKT